MGTATPSHRPILMLAPEPVLQPRGTPLSVYHRLRALSELGYHVDLVAYPLGEPIEIPRIRVLQVWRPWGLRRIKIGPSLPKLLLDLFLAVVALGCLVRRRYAAIHSHEEAVVIGAGYSRLFRIPHLYDMHSSLPQQLTNWRQWYAAWIRSVASRAERWAIRHSDVVITICPALTEYLQAIGSATCHITIENVMTFESHPTADAVAALRASHQLDGSPLIVYTGNFEPYQGVELLFESFLLVHRQVPQARLMMVGGDPSAIAARRAWAIAHGVERAVQFVGTVPPQQVPSYLAAADVLASPRIAGTNTPLKLYAYLKAGKPIVATNLPTHTQILTQEIAMLAPADPSAFGGALLEALTNVTRAVALGRNARAFAEENLSDARYRARVAEAYRLLLRGAS